MQNIAVSIIICTYNRADYLNDSLRTAYESALYSSAPTEIIIVNNNSTDNTSEIVNTFISTHQELPVILVNEINVGVSCARNKGFDTARGSIICFIDDEVLVPQQWLSEIIKTIYDNPDIGCVAGRILLDFPDINIPSWIDEKYHTFFGKFDHGDDNYIMINDKAFFTGNVALTRQTYENIGKFDQKIGRNGSILLSGEDTDYACRVASSDTGMAYSATGYLYHRVQPNRLSFNWIKQRYFWQGVTCQYLRNNKGRFFPFNFLPKLISNVLLLPLILFTFRKKYLYCTIFRISSTVGTFYGWYYFLFKVKAENNG